MVKLRGLNHCPSQLVPCRSHGLKSAVVGGDSSSAYGLTGSDSAHEPWLSFSPVLSDEMRGRKGFMQLSRDTSDVLEGFDE